MNPKKGQFSMPGFEGTSTAFDSLIKSGESIVEKRKGNKNTQTQGSSEKDK